MSLDLKVNDDLKRQIADASKQSMPLPANGEKMRWVILFKLFEWVLGIKEDLASFFY